MTTDRYRPIDVVITQEMNLWDHCAVPAYHYAKAVTEGRVDPAETDLDVIIADAGLDVIDTARGEWTPGRDDVDRGIAGIWAFALGYVVDADTEEGYTVGDEYPLHVWDDTLRAAHLTLEMVHLAFAGMDRADRVEAACESIVRGNAHLHEILALRGDN